MSRRVAGAAGSRIGRGRPAEYMDTLTAQEPVSSLLIQSQVGVFA